MDDEQIAGVIAELRPIAGGRIQKVDRVGPREIVLSIRVPGRTLLLLINADLDRIHLVDARPPRTVAGGSLQRTLRQQLEGRPLVSLALAGRAIEIDALETRLAVRLDDKRSTFQFLPPSGAGAPKTFSPVPERFERSEALAAEYAVLGPKEAENRLKSALLAGARKRATKLARLEKNLERDLEKLKAMQAGAALGELLKTMLHQVPRGSPEIQAVDWTTGEPIRVPLDPALSAKANMQRFFSKAKKGARGLPIVERRLDEVRSKRRALEEERERIQAASGDALIRLAERAGDETQTSTGGSPKRTTKKKPIDQWSRRFVAEDGSEIRVGRGAKENDRLTLQGTRGHDIWLHARGTAGAHVVLRVEKGRSPGKDALMDAAHLAVFFSSAKNESKAEVIQTEARNVKKTKGDPPGRVSVAKGKTILIDVDPKRLDRLLGRER